MKREILWWQVANNTTSALTTRRNLPNGTPRGTDTPLTTQRGLVQGLNDPALGLTRIGARDYDPATGRFLQPDPIIDTNTTNQWNPYGYDNNPIDQPDPTGLRPDDMDQEMYAAYLGEFRWSRNNGYSHSNSIIRANNRAYNTPSGRAGGDSWKSWAGVDHVRYERGRRTTWRFTQRYRSTPSSHWGSIDKELRAAQRADVRAAAAAKIWNGVKSLYSGFATLYGVLAVQQMAADVYASAAGIEPDRPDPPAAAPGISTQDLLQQYANAADATVRANQVRIGAPTYGPQYGVKVHKEFSRLIKAGNHSNLASEQVWYRQQAVGSGQRMRGSSVPDVVEFDPNGPIAVYDLKTGSARMSKSQAAGLKRNVDPNITIRIIRPQ